MIWKKANTPLLPLIIAALFAGCSDDKKSEPVAPDTTPPKVVATSPVDGATQVPVGSIISVTFSEKMNIFTFNDSAFVVRNQSGSAIPRSSLDDNGNTVIFFPRNRLNHDEIYTVTIADSVEDLAGNPLDSNYIWSFTTEPNIIMPLAIGNRWEFAVDLYDTVTDSIVGASLDTIEIVRDTIIQDERWFVDRDGLLYANRTDGLWRVAASGQPYLLLKFPATVGETYSADPDFGELMEVIATSLLIGVPQGFHICHQYHSRSTDPVFDYMYYNEFNIGPVAVEKRTSLTLKLAERRALKKYNLF